MGIPYKKTPFFRIPFLANGSTLSEESEGRAANIIENQLLAATKGIKCTVFRDGMYRAVNNLDGTWTVLLSSTGENCAIEGVVHGGYCFSSNPVLWENLEFGKEYYLYVTYQDGMYEDETNFGTSARIHAVDNKVSTFLYLAKVDLTGDKPVIDSNPDGKIHGTNVALHATDKENPHGETLVQENIDLNNILWGLVPQEDGSTKKISLWKSNGGGALNAAIKKKTILLDAMSGGADGVDVSLGFEAEIQGAIVHEKVWEGQGPTFLLGEIAIRTYSDKVQVYNAGEVGVTMTVTVFYIERFV